ncbi:chalcone isomerase family protein [Psychrilyobacter atlanticus]|uniref:chalcone isomerase family protein n=1 Tax=Psychrilyobacter atlanticus TaxID=271091 RepID=UPI0003FF3FF5|nr:chalcone isomerase family protein [Psychrilyobacter atlanticus]
MWRGLITVILGILMGVSAMAVNIAGVDVKEDFIAVDKKMVLNGAGIRKKLFFKLYVGSLYLPEKTMDAVAIVEGDKNMTIELNIISKLITSSKLKEALEEGFSTVEPKKMEQIKDRLKIFTGIFEGGKVKSGDVFTFNYIDGKVETYKNGKHILTTEGQDFKEALFGIWLGDRAIDKGLKAEMLGKS